MLLANRESRLETTENALKDALHGTRRVAAEPCAHIETRFALQAYLHSPNGCSWVHGHKLCHTSCATTGPPKKAKNAVGRAF